MSGYVYKIISNQTDKCYVGSTINNINERFSKHKSKYKMYLNEKYHYVTSFEIMKYDDAKIILIDEIEFEIKKELHELEGKYIRELNCVNRCISGRTNKEWIEDNKEHLKEQTKIYREKNKDIINEKQKYYREGNKELMKDKRRIYNEENKDIVKEKRRIYREDNIELFKKKDKKYYEGNIDKIKERTKIYREKNKDKIKQYHQEEITCECGSIIKKGGIIKHTKTKKHLDYIKEN